MGLSFFLSLFLHACILFPLRNIVFEQSIFHDSSTHRLLLMEEYSDWVLVHPVGVRHDQQVRKRTGDPAHHDPSEPQGGSRV